MENYLKYLQNKKLIIYRKKNIFKFILYNLKIISKEWFFNNKFVNKIKKKVINIPNEKLKFII